LKQLFMIDFVNHSEFLLAFFAYFVLNNNGGNSGIIYKFIFGMTDAGDLFQTGPKE